MTLNLRDNYMDGGDPAGKMDAHNPDEEKAREARKFNKKLTLRLVLPLAAFFAAFGVAAPLYRQHEIGAYKEARGGEECHPLWKEVESELDAMRRLDSNFKEETASEKMSGYRLKKYENAKAETNRRFSEKARVWINCLERKQQKNAPVAVQPKPLVRARSNL